MKFKLNFKTTLPHVAMTSTLYGDHDRAENVEMETSISVDPEHRYGGWYETYDTETGGGRFYAEGVLEVTHDTPDGTFLTGYDGCFDLPEYIIEALEEKGVIIDL
jgi:hypothetical protein